MREGIRRFLFGAIALAGVGLAAWFALPTLRIRSVVNASIPSRPDLTTWPPVFSDLIVTTEKAARDDSHRVAALSALAQLYHANGFYPEASQCYAGLIQLEPDAALWTYLQANLLSGFGRLPEALPLLQRTIELAPDYLPARLRLGDALRKTDQTTAAVHTYSTVLKRDPGNAFARLGLALCAIDHEDWSTAREQLQQAISVQPAFFGGWSLLVTVHEHFGDAALADAARRQARAAERFRDFPDPWLEALTDHCYQAYRLSVAAGGTADRASAKRWLERAIALAPENGFYQRQLGTVLFQANDYAAAQPHLEQAVALAEDDADAWALLVGLLAARNDFSGAEKALARGLARNPQSGPLHYENGQRLHSTGQLHEAIDELQTSKKLQPHDARPFLELALVYFELRQPERGLQEIETAIAAEPANPLPVRMLVEHAIAANDETQARRGLQQLRQIPNGVNSPNDPLLAAYAKRFGRTPLEGN